MRAITVTEGDKTFTNFQSIVPMDGLEADNTVLDPILGSISSVIDLPVEVDTPLCGPVTSVVYPGGYATAQGGSYILNDIQIAANNLLRLIEDYNPLDFTKLEKSVLAYHATLVGALSGKKGLLNRQIFTQRAGCSVRAVAVATITRGPEWVAVPKSSMMQMGAIDGDLCTAVRFPCLWDGSVEVVRMYAVDNDCIGVHPVLHRQLNLDHDGDTVSLWRTPKELRDEAEQHVLSFYRSYDEKVKPYPVAVTKGESWDTDADIDEIHEELVAKLAPTGRSIGPEDLMDGTVEWYEQSAGKDLIADTQQIMSGIDLAEIRQRVCNVNQANLIMKRYVGPAGSLGTALKVTALSTGDETIQRSAMYINERLTQSLMDAKHNVGATDQQGFMQVMDALCCRRDMDGATRKQVIAKLVANGMDADRVRPYIDHFFVEGPNDSKQRCGVKNIFEDTHPFVATSTSMSNDEEELIALYRRAGSPEHAEDAFTAAALRVLS